MPASTAAWPPPAARVVAAIAEKHSGATTGSPTPVRKKPVMATAGNGATITSSVPAQAASAPARTVVAAPNRSATRSPASRDPRALSWYAA